MATGFVSAGTILYCGPDTSYPMRQVLNITTDVNILWREGGYYYVQLSSPSQCLYASMNRVTVQSGSVPVFSPTFLTRYITSEEGDTRLGPGSSNSSATKPEFPFSVGYIDGKKENGYAFIEYIPASSSTRTRAWYDEKRLASNPRTPGKYIQGGNINYESDKWYISNDWGKNRVAPGHLGIDVFRHDKGNNQKPYKNIYAIASGTVVASEYGGDANGNCIIIRHSTSSSKTYYSTYCHLDSMAVGVGDVVSTGKAIGVMGKTGNAEEAVHLHLHITRENAGVRAYGYYRNSSGDKVSFDESRTYIDLSYNRLVRYYNPTAYFSQGEALINNNYS